LDRARRNLLIGGAVAALAAVLSAKCAKGGHLVPSRSGPRTRAPGRPKPLIDEDIGPTLARLDAWYAAHLSDDRYAFNPPASEQQLDSFERIVGIRLPRSYRQLYRWHDGEDDDRWGHIYGLPLLSLRAAAFQWNAWNAVLADFGGDRYKIAGDAWPKGAVDPAYINPRWIPLTHDRSGNHIGVDFDPWPAGRVGQLILYGRDEDVKAVLAPSLGSFLDWIADLLERGNFTIQTDGKALRQFGLKVPPADSFMDGARKLVGAPGPFVSTRSG
jgi:cell wall assembly regulator SMI1